VGGQPRARFGWVDSAERSDLPGSTFDFVLKGTDVREHVLCFPIMKPGGRQIGMFRKYGWSLVASSTAR
jgi:hypothetical protein